MALLTISSFVEELLQSDLLEGNQRDEVPRLQESLGDTRQLAQELLRREWLTAFQINQILQGKGGRLTMGPYVLLERIGEGGMGQVYKAKQKILQRVVALKVIRKECLGNPRIIQRFQREIRAAAQLSHPHIVRALDADQVNGTYFFAMEFIDGVNLAKMVDDNGPLPVNRACEYIRQAAIGLQHAFERGLVHRDIKPANLLVTRAVANDHRRSSGMIPRPLNLPSTSSGAKQAARRQSGELPRVDVQHYPWGVVKILDMGLARCDDSIMGREATHLTQIGSMMGTPEFIAPEQARDSHTTDIRADLYSLGCTLYFLLAGQAPFPKGTLTEKLMQHQYDEPEPIAGPRRSNMTARKGEPGPAAISESDAHVPAAVARIVGRLMAKLPEDRYQTPLELAGELQILLKQMAEGTLPPDVESERSTAVMPALGSPGEGASATVQMQPLVRVPPVSPSSAPRWMGKTPILMAIASGLGLVVIVTLIAVLLSRGSFTQAGVPERPARPQIIDGAERDPAKKAPKKTPTKRSM